MTLERLKSVFSFTNSCKDLQTIYTQDLLYNRDVVVYLATNYGKSFTFQAWPIFCSDLTKVFLFRFVLFCCFLEQGIVHRNAKVHKTVQPKPVSTLSHPWLIAIQDSCDWSKQTQMSFRAISPIWNSFTDT